MPIDDPAGDLLAGNGRYKTLKYVNKGSFGYVILAEDKETQERVAIKFVKIVNDEDKKLSQREIMNHQQLLHPHVVQLKEVFSVPPYLALVMEYVSGGDLFNYVVSRKGLAEQEARWFFQQLILGMDYCHRKGVCNRDIKLENTLLMIQPNKKPLLKMCDFGYSKSEMLDSIAKSKVGTPGYTAPEVITNVKGYDGKIADVWSAGVMLYTILYARYPFERSEDKSLKPADKVQKVLRRIINVDYAFPSSPAVSDEAKDLMKRIMVADPSKRLTIKDIQMHPWFQKDLPAGSLEYNDWALQAPSPPLQTPENVNAVIDAAYNATKTSPKGLMSDEDLLEMIASEEFN